MECNSFMVNQRRLFTSVYVRSSLRAPHSLLCTSKSHQLTTSPPEGPPFFIKSSGQPLANLNPPYSVQRPAQFHRKDNASEAGFVEKPVSIGRKAVAILRWIGLVYD